MSNLNIEEIKELLEEFPFNQDKEIISKFIAGEKLTQRNSTCFSYVLSTLLACYIK